MSSSKKGKGGTTKGRERATAGRESVDWANRPGPGETSATMENSKAPSTDIERQGGGRALEAELFVPAIEDDAGGLPNQVVPNVGPVPEGAALPPGPTDEPRSLPRKSPTL